MSIIARPLATDLPPVEAALLWTMRAWVIGHCHGKHVAGRIEDVYEQLGAPEAAPYLDGMMWAVSQSAERVLDVNCVCHPDVSADESALLDAVALHQAALFEDAYVLLCGMLSARGASAACDSAFRLGSVLGGAGIGLPRAGDAVRQYAFLARTPQAVCGSAAIN